MTRDRRGAAAFPVVVKPPAVGPPRRDSRRRRGVRRRGGADPPDPAPPGSARLRGPRPSTSSRSRATSRATSWPSTVLLEAGTLSSARAVRQAGPARRAVLRGDHLRGAVAGAPRPRQAAIVEAIASGGPGARAVARAHPRRVPRDARGGRVRAGSRGAAHRRAVRARRPRPRRPRRRGDAPRGTPAAARPRRAGRRLSRREAADVGGGSCCRFPEGRRLPPRGGGRRARTQGRIPHVDVRITARPDQRLVPLPEGASYLGFVFARPAARRRRWSGALRAAHAALHFRCLSTPAIPLVHFSDRPLLYAQAGPGATCSAAARRRAAAPRPRRRRSPASAGG